jgi:AcrR family transcriptional regulator
MAHPKPKKDASVIYRQLLEAATEEFADKGYAGARMDEIARKAKINKAMIYYHIGDKESLYAAVLNATFGNMAAVMEKNIIWEKPPAENLHVYFQTIGDSILQNPRIPPIMLRETASGGQNLPEAVVQSLSTILEILAQIIKQGVENNEFHPALALILHFMFISPFVFLKQMEALIKQQINLLGPENIGNQWPENMLHEIESLIYRAVLIKG